MNRELEILPEQIMLYEFEQFAESSARRQYEQDVERCEASKYSEEWQESQNAIFLHLVQFALRQTFSLS